MTVKILYVDIRDEKQTMEAFTVAWRRGLSASEAVRQALEKDIADGVIHDLNNNSPEVGVAWHDEKIEKHSEVGGVGDLDWEIPDKSVLIIVYENESTTQQQVDLSSDWMTENSSGE